MTMSPKSDGRRGGGGSQGMVRSLARAADSAARRESLSIRYQWPCQPGGAAKWSSSDYKTASRTTSNFRAGGQFRTLVQSFPGLILAHRRHDTHEYVGESGLTRLGAPDE